MGFSYDLDTNNRHQILDTLTLAGGAPGQSASRGRGGGGASGRGRLGASDRAPEHGAHFDAGPTGAPGDSRPRRTPHTSPFTAAHLLHTRAGLLFQLVATSRTGFASSLPVGLLLSQRLPNYRARRHHQLSRRPAHTLPSQETSTEPHKTLISERAAPACVRLALALSFPFHLLPT